ncbi:NAD+ synthase [Pampinifervens florentissimum]|uniref:NAD+ synthase n=1 Tax=Pampinifervens florentissimum TaxID=1632019 RepID=UPI0013B49D48|nr:NAD+ synthase [Hydrogenobacter sp. T-8]QID32466.1 NAD+ synthase [Hydrogenobacter sp. T-8]
MFLNIALCQINPVVGGIRVNLQKIEGIWERVDTQAHLVVFPELSLCGYPPEDLLLRLDFVRSCERSLKELLRVSEGMSSLLAVGMPYYEGDLYNALVLVGRGQLLGIYKKTFLPNYSVFDEKRYFRAGKEPLILEINGVKVGFSICEDIWHPDGWERFYALSGCEVLVNINASPYYRGKYEFKENFLRARAQDNIAYVVYVNMVGGQDELVFDGRSVVIDPEGKVIARASSFEEDLLLVSLDIERVRRKRLLDLRLRERQVEKTRVVSFENTLQKGIEDARVEASPKQEEELYKAIVLAIRDYVGKNGFQKVVLGLSGGIDSSLVACLAVDALGRDRVVGVFMPSEYTSTESREDVYELAENLQIELLEYAISEIYRTYLETFGSRELTVAEENLQARIRANILFYLSNLYGWLVLSTSNKSESAVGYTTIYGDMAGGFAPIKDLYKTWVYKLARYRNSIKPDIPERVLIRPPTAELRPNQTDQDTLPPYELLDKVLELHIEEGMGLEEIVALGFDRELVKKVLRMVRRAEYKRRQAPIGPKLTKRAFGKDWRMPISGSYF